MDFDHDNHDGHSNSQDGNRPFRPHRERSNYNSDFGDGKKHSRGGFGRRFDRDGEGRPPRREGGFGRRFDRDSEDRPPRREGGFGRRFDRDGEDRPPRREGGFGRRFDRDGEDRPPRREGGFGRRFDRDGEDRPPRREGGFGRRFDRDDDGRPPRREGGFGRRFDRDGEDCPPRRPDGFGRRFERNGESFVKDRPFESDINPENADAQATAENRQTSVDSERAPRMGHSSHVSENILLEALHYLSTWENARISLDDCLDDLRESKFHEKAAVASLLFEYFRHKDFLDKLMAKHAEQELINQDMRLLISLAAVQVFFQTGLAWQSAVNIAVDVGKQIRGYGGGSFVNAMLRTYLRDTDIDRNNIPVVCPPLLMERWTEQYGEEKANEIGSFFASNPALSVRLRKDVDPGLLAEFEAEPVQLDFNSGDFRFYELKSPRNFFESDLLHDGLAYVQDPATAMGLGMVEQGMLQGNIIDLCAAPGGKTIMMAELADPRSKIIAVDKVKARVFRMNVNLRRAGLKIHTVEADAREVPFPADMFNFVLADVPCTNTGVIRRRPDVPWRFSKTRIEEITPLQIEILRSAARLTAPGGYILYSTCSLEQEENHGRIQVFLDHNPDWTLVKESTLLPASNHDGAYAALLRAPSQKTNPIPVEEEPEVESDSESDSELA